MAGAKLQTILLSNALKDYSLDAIKAALSQSELNEELMEGILKSKGLKDELLKNNLSDILKVQKANKEEKIIDEVNDVHDSLDSLGYAFSGLKTKIVDAGKSLLAFFKTPVGGLTAALTVITGVGGYHLHKHRLSTYYGGGGRLKFRRFKYPIYKGMP